MSRCGNSFFGLDVTELTLVGDPDVMGSFDIPLSSMWSIRCRGCSVCVIDFLERSHTSLETCRDSVLSVNNGRVAAFVLLVNFFSLAIRLKVRSSRFIHCRWTLLLLGISVANSSIDTLHRLTVVFGLAAGYVASQDEMRK